MSFRHSPGPLYNMLEGQETSRVWCLMSALHSSGKELSAPSPYVTVSQPAPTCLHWDDVLFCKARPTRGTSDGP